ncbi:FAD binding domain-containing protein [Aquabacter cavernae]|uniref:FAD binding domain-containing protein n=1 Tax=Aquabacter cavernae TaxID=2496029 RepID=UPI000F8D4A96|nr:FAD binding domain-containing protein [Aquabacter cavernae]
MAGSGNPGPRRALIIGGSMAGLFAGLSLLRDGWDVHVFERIGSELSGRGAGIVTHAELLDILKTCGADSEAARVGVFVPGRRVFARDGAVAGELRLEQVVTSWGHLYALLRSALPSERYHHGRTLTRVEEAGARVRAHFDDGSVEEGDLLIGADGIASTIRQQFMPDVQASYVGYIAWRGLVPEGLLSENAQAELADYFAFSLPPGEQMLGYPVAGENEALERGRRRFNFVWYRPAPAGTVLADMLTDTDGVRHALSIPPNKIRPDVIAEMRRAARETLSPQFAEVVERTAHPFIQVIQDLVSPRMVLGRRTLILGDAAFVARPHVGMGVTKAAGDADALARLLREQAQTDTGMDAALAAFEAERQPYGAAVVRRARQLGSYLQADLVSEEDKAAAAHHCQPDAIMAETAVNTGIAA